MYGNMSNKQSGQNGDRTFPLEKAQALTTATFAVTLYLGQIFHNWRNVIFKANIKKLGRDIQEQLVTPIENYIAKDLSCIQIFIQFCNL